MGSICEIVAVNPLLVKWAVLPSLHIAAVNTVTAETIAAIAVNEACFGPPFGIRPTLK